MTKDEADTIVEQILALDREQRVGVFDDDREGKIHELAQQLGPDDRKALVTRQMAMDPMEINV